MKPLSMIIGLTLAVGCSSSDTYTGLETTTNTTSASSTVVALSGIPDAFATGDGTTVATGVIAAVSSATGIIVPTTSAARPAPRSNQPYEGTCTCTDSGCTFEGCTDGYYTIDGSISVSGDTYVWDLTMTVIYTGYDWTWTYSGDMTVTETSIDGELHGDATGDYSGGGSTVTYTWGVDAEFNDIVLTDGCATDGSMSVSSDYEGSASTSSGSGSYSYAGSATISFGPTCGEVTAS